MEETLHFGSSAKNYKYVSWSPDGTAILATNEDDSVHVINPVDGFEASRFLASGTVNDVCWYPWMRPEVPGSNCYLTAIHGQPLKIVDASTGLTRTVYKPMNHLDELDNCISCTFSPDGRQIYGGANEKIYKFDVGSATQQSCIKTRHNRKSRDGQGGPISALTPRWDDSGVLAAGSFSGSIGIYDMREAEPMVLLLKANNMGVTQVKFDPVNGMDLYVAHRHSDSLDVWDLRFGEKASWRIPRPARTNQRLYFDITPDGRKLFTGSSNNHGDLLELDLEHCKLGLNQNESTITHSQAHKDIVAAVALNLLHPTVLVTCSGQRHFENDNDDDGTVIDNSIKTWKLR